MPSRKHRAPPLAQPVTDSSIDVWAALMADAPEPRRADDLDLSQIAERRHIKQNQARIWAEEQVRRGLLAKHKIKDEITQKPKSAYHPAT